jgi:nitroimidazol reductase NimA-like FMN-containing flavoprotein (pyridoxamine 5'-phosphate oxidase superfamily)
MTDQPKEKTIDRVKLASFLSRPLLARMGTARNNQPHVTPVWFQWDGESIWISAFSSTRKLKELRQNPKCSIVIDTDFGQAELAGAILEGEADLITYPEEFMHQKTTEIYIRYLGPQGVLEKDPQSWIHDPENTLIKLTPQKIYTW